MQSLLTPFRMSPLDSYVFSKDFLASYYKCIPKDIEIDSIQLANEYLAYLAIWKRNREAHVHYKEGLEHLSYESFLQNEQKKNEVQKQNEFLTFFFKYSLQNRSLITYQRLQGLKYLTNLIDYLDGEQQKKANLVRQLSNTYFSYPYLSSETSPSFVSTDFSFLDEKQEVDRIFSLFIEFKKFIYSNLGTWIKLHTQQVDCANLSLDTPFFDLFSIVLESCEALSKDFCCHFERFLNFRKRQLTMGKIKSGQSSKKNLNLWLSSFSFFECAMKEIMAYLEGKDVHLAVLQDCLTMNFKNFFFDNSQSILAIQVLLGSLNVCEVLGFKLK